MLRRSALGALQPNCWDKPGAAIGAEQAILFQQAHPNCSPAGQQCKKPSTTRAPLFSGQNSWYSSPRRLYASRTPPARKGAFTKARSGGGPSHKVKAGHASCDAHGGCLQARHTAAHCIV